ncbi:hypothetical protein V5799_009478 [Amblyomma americanum]|uniref:Secreted protein n=1 Tax=Amblyomma americanum TaxID=6943 RepID=A0AAQ4FAT8_AMBAM
MSADNKDWWELMSVLLRVVLAYRCRSPLPPLALPAPVVQSSMAMRFFSRIQIKRNFVVSSPFYRTACKVLFSSFSSFINGH